MSSIVKARSRLIAFPPIKISKSNLYVAYRNNFSRGLHSEVNTRDNHKWIHSLPPNGAKQVLLHSCCAPCSGAMIEEMQEMGIDITVFFYNPNIHPVKEYEIRKDENKKFAEYLGIPFVDADYDVDEWYERAKGMELDPERGRRCSMCFDMRLDRTALYAFENQFPVFTTTNATSRWKDIDQVNASGIKVSHNYEGVEYWVYDWQTDRMTKRKYEIAATRKFYKQEYCGCTFSLRDSNLWRKDQGLGAIKVGKSLTYTDPEMDCESESQEVVDSFFQKYESKLEKMRRNISHDDSQQPSI